MSYSSKRVTYSLGLVLITAFAAPVGAGGAPNAESDRNACSARLSDFAWLEGKWSGQIPFGAFTMEYSGVSGGVITSMFRLMPEDQTSMLEFACLRETDEGLELRFRHFGRDLIGWEEKDTPLILKCVSSTGDSWTFENPIHDRPKRSVITRVSNDEYTFRSQIGSGDAARFMEGTVHRVGRGISNRERKSSRVLTKETIADGTPAQVWAAWTNPKEMSKFFAAASSIIDLRVGGTYELHMVPEAPPGSRGCEGCTVLSYLPLRMISFTWTAPPSIPGLRDKGIKTHVVVTMDEAEAGKTRVRITQMGFGEGDDWDKCYAYFDKAWPKVLERLGQSIGSIAPTKDVLPSDPRLTYDIEVDAPPSEVWKGFTTKEGVESWMVPLAEVDLKLNGMLRTNYNTNGTIGDPGTITHRFMSFEPGRMLSFQVIGCPAGFPHAEATKGTWAVLQLDPIGADRTRVRLTSAGLEPGSETEEMIKFFEQGNARTLAQLQKRFGEAEGKRIAAGSD